MPVLDRLEFILRDIRDRIYLPWIELDNWKMEVNDYLGPGEYEVINKGLISLGDEWDNTGKTVNFVKDVQLPAHLIGQELYLELKIGGEAALYVNGDLKRGINERYLFLTTRAEREYNLRIEATWHVHDSVRHPRKYQEKYPRHHFETARIVTKNHLIEEYYYLLKIVVETMRTLPAEEQKKELYRVIKASLNQVLFFKEDEAEFTRSVKQGLKLLREELARIPRVPSTGRAYLVAHSHLDLAFKWPFKETIRKAKRTLSTTIEQLDRYDYLYFVFSQPQLYEYIREYYPHLYQRVKEKIGEGRLEPIGAMWVEADTNLSSGEALVRQLLYGQEFYEKEFGLRSKTCFLPDCFGFSASLPQILKKAGLKYFFTTKLHRNDTNQYPHHLFKWRGIDGSSIRAYLLPRGNHGTLKPKELLDNWNKFNDKDVSNTLLYFYGYGDGGGGVTEELLKAIPPLKEIPYLPRIETGRLEDHFEDVFNGKDLKEWWGELYFESHRGTYTSQAILKKENRRAEFLLREAEFYLVIADLFNRGFISREGLYRKLRDVWKLLLKNQFHDILPGSCIREVVDDALEDYRKIRSIGELVKKRAIDLIMDKVAAGDKELIVFNSLPWQRTDIVYLPESLKDITAILNEKGEELPLQQDDRGLCFIARDIPETGYRCFQVKFKNTDAGDGRADKEIIDNKSIGNKSINNSGQRIDNQGNKKEVNLEGLSRDSINLSNNYFEITVNKQGNLSRIYDRHNDREILALGEEGNQLQIFEDKSTYYDTWDLAISEDKKWIINDVEELYLKEMGPVYKSIYLKKKFNKTTIEQEIIIYDSVPRIDFKTRIDWQERQMLLKVAFPVDIIAGKAYCDIAFGNIERSIHKNTPWDIARSEVPAHKWADLSEDGYGVSLLNDCKYGYDIKDNVIRLTLLKGGIFPDPRADIGFHFFTYSLYPHGGNFREGGTIKQSYFLNQPLFCMFNQVPTDKRPTGPGSASFIKIDKENVVLETVKPAEDGDGYILRFYESFGRRSRTTVSLAGSIHSLQENDLMEREAGTPGGEKNPTELPKGVTVDDNWFSFTIRPYEIKTFRIRMKGGVLNVSGKEQEGD